VFIAVSARRIKEFAFAQTAGSVLVGLVGFEPTASTSRTWRSTKLSHSPF
jgi:hypothetical protein